MKLHIPIELANQIIGYLGTRPYQEVYQLIDSMKDAAKPPVLQPVSTTENQWRLNLGDDLDKLTSVLREY